MKALIYIILPAVVAGLAVGLAWYPLVDAVGASDGPRMLVPWTAAVCAAIIGYGRWYKPARKREFGPNASY